MPGAILGRGIGLGVGPGPTGEAEPLLPRQQRGGGGRGRSQVATEAAGPPAAPLAERRLVGVLRREGFWRPELPSAGRGFAQKFLGGSAGKAALQAALLPWTAFLTSSLILTFGSHAALGLAASLVLLWAGACFAWAETSAAHGRRGRAVRADAGRSKVPISGTEGAFDAAYALLLCGLAVLAGAAAGFYIYSSVACDYWKFGEHRMYTNVWPDELAAAHRDASAIVFAQGARPNLQMSVSYRTGSHTYCVAPVVMHAQMMGPQIQFWAAGLDCCGGRGEACNDAADPRARAGLVVHNRTGPLHGFIPNEAEHYAEAARMATAKFGLLSAERPIFVRWVREPEVARDHYLRDAWLHWFETGCLFLPLSMLMGLGAPSLVAAGADAARRRRDNAAEVAAPVQGSGFRAAPV
mmetsp:Transcript_37959/g.80706  ORF Transcript_37959/g.80706 Transcript_37959/m.80706 type:complete len:410 (+) Transcript_37959:121-1350(+)